MFITTLTDHQNASNARKHCKGYEAYIISQNTWDRFSEHKWRKIEEAAKMWMSRLIDGGVVCLLPSDRHHGIMINRLKCLITVWSRISNSLVWLRLFCAYVYICLVEGFYWSESHLLWVTNKFNSAVTVFICTADFHTYLRLVHLTIQSFGFRSQRYYLD